MNVATATVDAVAVRCYRFPTPAPESDATLSWDATTAVTVELTSGECTGLGWTYSTGAVANLIKDHLEPLLLGRRCSDISGAWVAARSACRNLGTKGLTMHALSAVDIAMWDLKSRLLGVSLPTLFGQMRECAPVYGSGGFVSESDDELAESVDDWKQVGCRAMKIKIGKDGGRAVDWDIDRVRYFRETASSATTFMVDANGAYSPGQARRVGDALDRMSVRWFEEPVTSDDAANLALLRTTLRCDIAAGEYISDSYDAAHLAGAVDCLQLDVTRCGGYTGFLRGAAIAHSHNIDVSAHCAPALHAAVAVAVPHLRHVEYFADHARLEPLLVDGGPPVRDGALWPSARVPGHGMTIADTAGSFELHP